MSETWEELKNSGSDHYKGGVEPIDLYKSGGMFHDFAVSSIMKYAYRNRRERVDTNINLKDLDKIIHYAKLLKVLYEEEAPVQISNILFATDRGQFDDGIPTPPQV